MKRIGLLAVILAGLTMSACEYAVGYATYAPPPIRVETYGPAPGPGYVWANGYWGYRGGAYAWTPGTWRRPPRGRTVWEPGRWEQRGGRYRFTQGHWR